MLKRSSRILTAVMTPTVLASMVACNAKSQRAEANAAEIPSAKVATVTRGTVTHRLNVAGQFQPYQVVDVHAKVSGYVQHIYVDIGDRVHQGQVLAVLEVPELNAQVKGTISEMARSKDEITRDEQEVIRAKSEHLALHADYVRLKQVAEAQVGLIAQQELDNAQSKDLAAEAQVDAAKAALAAARKQAEVADADNERVSALAAYTKVTAPLDGVVTWRYADTGALIQAGTVSDVQSLPLVKLSQSGLLRLRLPVPEDAVQYIREGSEVQVRVDALNRSFVGKVIRFTRNVSLETRTMETEIDVENKDLSLTPGMYANTTLQLERHANVLTIPPQAVIGNGNKAQVFVLDSSNHLQLRGITLGLQGPTLVEVKAGLSEGERVITGGQAKYQVDETVKPLPEHFPVDSQNIEQSERE
jgi:RND family efflux transporter MFP subunit